MSTQLSLPSGEFEITVSPRDTFRSLYAMMGGGAVFLLLFWGMAVFTTLQALLTGQALNDMASIVALAGVGGVVALAVSAVRGRGKRWTVRITDQSLTMLQETGEVSLRWAAITRLNERAGMLVMFADRIGLALPLYRMSEVQVASIRARLEAGGGTARAKKSRRTRSGLLVLWALLVLAFVVIWNLFNQS
jgi:hypothetical protein